MNRVLSLLILFAPIMALGGEMIRVAPGPNNSRFVMDFQVYASGRGCVQFQNIVVSRDFPNVIYNGRVERATGFRFFHSADGFNSVSTLSPSIEVPFDLNSWSIPQFRVCGLVPGQRVFTSGGLVNQAGTIIYFLPIEKSNEGTHSTIVR